MALLRELLPCPILPRKGDFCFPPSTPWRRKARGYADSCSSSSLRAWRDHKPIRQKRERAGRPAERQLPSPLRRGNQGGGRRNGDPLRRWTATESTNPARGSCASPANGGGRRPSRGATRKRRAASSSPSKAAPAALSTITASVSSRTARARTGKRSRPASTSWG